MLRNGRAEYREEKKRRATSLAGRVRQSLDAGNLAEAVRLVEGQVRHHPGNVTLRFQLAIFLQAAGERARAAAELARVLRLEPAHRDAAQRLGEVLAGGVLPPDTHLDAAGLANALEHRTVDRDLIGAAALSQLARKGPLAQALARAQKQGVDVAARDILGRRASELIRDDLLLAVLARALVADRRVEALLAALRRSLLLDVAPERLGERNMLRFAVAMAELGAGNEYVFARSPEETARLEALDVPVVALLGGDAAAAQAMLLHALYRDPIELLPAEITPEALAFVRPPEFATLLRNMLAERREIAAHQHRLQRHGAISSEISLKVAGQYRTHPYPRWRSVPLFKSGEYTKYLGSFFSAAQLAFVQRPFEVLVAGCGTGCQAVSAALDYGSNAEVTAIDISGPSLAYGAMMAGRLGAANVSFALADIGEIATFEPPWTKRFQVIECSGVLHHMARPFAAWAGLLDCLDPGGIMLVGLYSRTARQELEELRREAAYPGAGCSDEALRAYRQDLLARPETATGASYMRSRDVYSTSGFRDFFLHVSEQTTTLDEIQAFLDTNGLAFRGFVNVPFAALRQRFPDEVWPGRLDRWAQLESERPQLFVGMYQFWIARR